jgi:hypothetical protein
VPQGWPIIPANNTMTFSSVSQGSKDNAVSDSTVLTTLRKVAS